MKRNATWCGNILGVRRAYAGRTLDDLLELVGVRRKEMYKACIISLTEMSKLVHLVTVMLRFKIFHHFQTFRSGAANMYVINLTYGKWILIHSMYLSARLAQNYDVH